MGFLPQTGAEVISVSFTKVLAKYWNCNKKLDNWSHHEYWKIAR